MTSPTSVRLKSGLLRGGLVLALAGMLGWAPAPVTAQETGTLVGTVRDAASQRPLEAVQVYIGGTGIGALTNAAGRFLLLNVPAGELELISEIVGYRSGSQTVTVGAGQSVVADFGMQQTAISLNEIVVTGAGVATEKRRLGNTVASIDAASLENAPIANFSQMIAGREPGVVALPSSGSTGEGAAIRIRGSSSLSQLNEPIIYVDGIRVDRSVVSLAGTGNPSRLDDIPPESIERVEILKGAAAATLYGTEASNGVIQIFTKRGRSGAPRFTAQADWTDLRTPTNRIESTYDYIGRDCASAGCASAADVTKMNEYRARMQNRFGVSPGDFEDFEGAPVTDWLGAGFGQVYSASVSGGSDLFQYFVSGRITDEDGVVDAASAFPEVEGLNFAQDKNRRVGFTSNMTVVPSSKLRISVSTLYSDMEQHTPENGNSVVGFFSSMLMSQPRRATTMDGGNYYGAPAFGTTREFSYRLNEASSNHFAGSTTIGYTPTESFRLDGTFGADFTSDDRRFFEPYGYDVDDFTNYSKQGSRRVNEDRSREITADLKGSHNTFITDNIENTLLFGTQGFMRQRQSAGGSGNTFPGPGLETLSALANQSASESWTRVTQLGGYVQDQVGINDWVFLTLGVRWDANSAFGEDFATARYPKASISVIPSQGLGWENDTFSTFRVRAAIGKSGLQPDAFAKFTTYQPRPSSNGPGVGPANLGNNALRPEVSTEWEVGAELGLFQDRWSLDATYWDRTVTDAMVSRQFSVTGGFTQEQLVNIGELVGSGVELSLQGALIQREGLTVNVFANTAYLKENITSLGGAPPLKTGGSYPRYRNYLLEGYAPGSFFGAKIADIDIPLNLDGSCTPLDRATAETYFANPVKPSTYKPLAVGNSDFDTPNGGYSSNNCGSGLLETLLGKPTPDFAGSAGFNMSFASNFELRAQFDYKWGGQNQDLSGMFRKANAVIGRNTPRAAELGAIMQSPTSSAGQRLDAAIAWAREIEGLSPMSGLNGIFDTNMIRFRELSLSYRIPSDIVDGWGLSTATINIGARNLAMWLPGSDYTGMDPETNVNGRCNGGLNCNFLQSTEGWALPIPRSFTLSTRFTF
ncbi:MAG: SusC/RagA family TonB-linked outer membrane protein [Longimicrobiales bacterium]|nr:SusC/RagA family TonB-linked outer membrane protein [Longimicrobiales bacterium]